MDNKESEPQIAFEDLPSVIKSPDEEERLILDIDGFEGPL